MIQCQIYFPFSLFFTSFRKKKRITNRKKATLNANEQLNFGVTNDRSLSAFRCKIGITGGT